MSTNKRIRPSSYIRSTANHVKLRKKWRTWLTKMQPELSDLHFKRKIFWDLQEIANDNPAILKPGNYFDWQCRNYTVTCSVIIRKFVDQSRHKSTQSLWKLLYEALEHPGALNRKSHLSLYKGVAREMSLGEGTFDEVAGVNSEYLSIGDIKKDISRLENSTYRIYKFVNKKIVHFTPPKDIRIKPILLELDEAIDSITNTYRKYNLILKADYYDVSNSLKILEPWKKVLKSPWIKSTS